MNTFIFVDKNECLIQNICRSPRPVCENIPGSYRCNYRPCQSGFERGRYGQCQGESESVSTISTLL